MGPVKLLLDTNVLSHTLDGTRQTRALLEGSKDLAVSLITWMEVMVGRSGDDEEVARSFLSTFNIIGISQPIAEEAVRVRRSMRVKLPDAIIYATALSTGRTLVTYNSRDFPSGTPGVEIPRD